MKLGSLFSGYGGLDQATEAAFGATTAWVSDIDPGACKILAHRYPDVPNLGDITAIDWSSVEPVDIITGGFPCQDLSHAGKRAGMRPDTRSGLWTHMAYAIDRLRPRMVVAENVRGLLSAEALGPVEPCSWCVGDGPEFDLRALGRVLADLADLGYDAQWCGLRAADVGAPHGRFRIFLVAADADRLGHERFRGARRRRIGPADGSRQPVNLLPTPTTTQRGTDANLDTREGARANLHNEVAHLLPTPSVADALGGHQRRGGSRGDELLLNGIAKYELLPTPMVGSTSPASHGQISGQFRDQMDAALARFGQYADAIARWESLTRSAPAPTEPTGRNGAHRLSPRFVEWMMGLPEGHVTDVPDLSRNAQLKALGNGVVPQQAYAALVDMLAAIERVAA